MLAGAGLTLISCQIKVTMCGRTGHFTGLGAKLLSTQQRVRLSLRERHQAMTKWRVKRTLSSSIAQTLTRLEAGVWPEAGLEPSLEGLEQHAKHRFPVNLHNALCENIGF